MTEYEKITLTATDGTVMSFYQREETPSNSQPDLKWVAHCETHGVTRFCATRRLARNMVANTSLRVTWCSGCEKQHGTRFLNNK